MPPSLPTGTVSHTSAGTRTFPPEPDRERASAASTGSSRRQQARTHPTTPTPASKPEVPPSAVVPRREHDVAVSREHERVAELEEENEALREYIEAQAEERQDVIERYERLLERCEAEAEAAAATTTASTTAESTTPSSPPGDESGIDVRATLSALRSRIASRLGLD